MPELSDILEQADALRARGRAREAIALLTDGRPVDAPPEFYRALVDLRYAGWAEIEPTDPPQWPVSVPDHFPRETGIPEVSSPELSGEIIRSALLHHGGLVVRGLLSEQRCAELRSSIDKVWDAVERYKATKEVDPEWFDPLDLESLSIESRAWPLKSGTSYVPDSPRLLFEFLAALEECDIRSSVADYFGEHPALSLVKLAQRRLRPDATGGWHQDGAVYGLSARTLNLWLPISPCGDVAPGLEMWPRRLDELVPTKSDTGALAFTASDEAVATLTDEVPAAIPIFAAGDAALFDQHLLHQTAASERYTEQRYGFECWLFAPSTYPQPERWIPLCY